MNNICINCIHKDVCYKYRLNYVCAREGTCINYYEIDNAPTVEERPHGKRAGTPLEENDYGYNCEDWIP